MHVKKLLYLNSPQYWPPKFLEICKITTHIWVETWFGHHWTIFWEDIKLTSYISHLVFLAKWYWALKDEDVSYLIRLFNLTRMGSFKYGFKNLWSSNFEKLHASCLYNTVNMCCNKFRPLYFLPTTTQSWPNMLIRDFFAPLDNIQYQHSFIKLWHVLGIKCYFAMF